MARWSDVEREAPELAAAAKAFFDARVHKTIATLRRDGSPRISGTGVHFVDGDLWLGMMPGSLKALDLRRDPRLAVHSASVDPPDWRGDAKLSGRAEELQGDSPDERAIREAIGAGEGDSHLFRVDIEELSVVRLGEPADHLMVESWRSGRGLTPARRR